MSEALIRSMLAYFLEEKFYRALFALEKDSGVHFRSFGREMDFLYDLICDGLWSEVLDFLAPFASSKEFDFSKCVFLIKKQVFLEEIETAEEPDVEKLSGLLREIESLVSKEELNQL